MACHVYLLRCGDGSYYCGHTDDLVQRLAQHETGRVAETAARRPVEAVWHGEFAQADAAQAFAQQLQGWTTQALEAWLAADAARRGGPSPRSGSAARAKVVMPAPLAARRAASAVARGAAATNGSPSVDTVAPAESADPLYAGVRRAEPRALAKAITLLESTRPDHRARADVLLNALLPHTGRSLRLGISGVPGVGKSTFIETLGLHLIAHGHRVAVLAVDPSSSLSGGSILGDKTRMERLSTCDAAYIRPSPSSGTLGGVAEKTREALLVCEAAGFDVVIVETVGVGQSEIAVAGMTDLFVLMQLPNAGDDLQAIKRGVMEIADLVVINKADLDADAATRAEAMIASSLRLLGQAGQGDGAPSRVLKLSALKEQGVDTFWQRATTMVATRRANGDFEQRRQQQGRAWMWDIVRATLLADFNRHPAVREALPGLLHDVNAARVAPSSAARQLLQLFTRT